MALVKFQPAVFPPVFRQAAQFTQPAVNVIQTKEGFRIDLAAPGLSREDFEVKIEDNLLKIRAQKSLENKTEDFRVHRHEFAYGSFERSFRLPETVDQNSIKARYENGILGIELELKPEAKPVIRSVEIA